MLRPYKNGIKKPRRESTAGQGGRLRVRFEPLEKNPENRIVSGARKQTKPYKSASQLPSFIRTITVGPGIHLRRTAFGAVLVSPDPARFFATLRMTMARGLYHRSGIHLHRTSLCTVQASPCPEGCYLVVYIISAMPFRCTRPGKPIHTAVHRSDLRIQHRWRRQ